MKIDRTQHISISGEVDYIRQIKTTIDEQRSQESELDQKIADLQVLKRELSNFIGRNESILTDNYEMI